MRGFGIFDADEGMEEMFGDLEELFEHCRFSDCAHGREPGCAVQAALADGGLDDRRWASYLKLQRELAALARRHDAAARRAYQREWHQKIAVAGKSQRSAERDSHENAKGSAPGAAKAGAGQPRAAGGRARSRQRQRGVTMVHRTLEWARSDPALPHPSKIVVLPKPYGSHAPLT